MLRTYTPGYSGIKAVLALCGVALFGMGLLQNRAPLVAAIYGTRMTAIVQRVERLKAGSVTDVYTTTQVIPTDDSRTAVFRYWIEMETPQGRHRQAMLAVAHQIRPAYLVGDQVAVCFNERSPDAIYGIYDWNTWTLGAILMVSGLIFTGVFLHLFLFARTPITIPDDTRDDVPV